MAVLAKERMRMPEKPIPTIAALARRAEALQHDINAALDDLVACDRESCPNLPEPVIKGLRTARHLHGFCACRWAQDEAEEKPMSGTCLGLTPPAVVSAFLFIAASSDKRRSLGDEKSLGLFPSQDAAPAAVLKRGISNDEGICK